MTTVPTSTYRLQLSADFGFDDARAVLPYLCELGVSHVHLSPSLRAVPGSAHGYDVIDPTTIDPDRGGEAAFEALLAAARDVGLGVVLDIVPNHVAASEESPWWRDVLTHGPSSRYATYFDIDWDPPEHDLRGRVLLPILGDTLEHEIAAGHVRLAAAEDGGTELAVYDRRLPLAPSTGDHVAPDADIERVLARQSYVLEFWRTGLRRLNWRRFFDVTELVGVRVEREEVFQDTHRRILDLVERGLVQGLRVDHPDGLRDPAGYFRRLRAAAPGAWIVVEKILGPDERLPETWPVAGTTGYDFLNAVDGLFVDPRSEEKLTSLCSDMVGECPDFETLRREKQRLVLRELFVPETRRLVRTAGETLGVGEADEERVRRAVVALLVEMPVYRTYVVESSPADLRDRHWIGIARDRALAHERGLDRDILDRLVAILCGDEARGDGGAEVRAGFQQLSGPAMAKGLEDTALYCDRRLVSLTEVGSDPEHFGTTKAGFEEACRHLDRQWPATMTAVNTHDTKRSADVRLRIAALSEIPDRFAEEVRVWRELARSHREHPDHPSRGAEYFLFQTLVGVWPAAVDRVRDYAWKAAREAKLRTSWLDPDEAYEEGLDRFIASLLSDERFTSRLESFVDEILPAVHLHSLSLTALWLTAVGVPDVYQGCEAWRENLTDPDNRRPVDFDALLGRLAAVAELDPGRVRDHADRKLWLTARLLRLRREHPTAFGPDSRYRPLEVTGADAERVIAHARGDRVAVVAPRLTVAHGIPRDARVRLPEGDWRDALHDGNGRVSGSVAELWARFPVAVLRRD